MEQNNVTYIKLYKTRRNLKFYISKLIKNSDIKSCNAWHHLHTSYPEYFLKACDSVDRDLLAIHLQNKINQFNKNLDSLYQNLKTNDSKFKIVGISTLYPKSLNPVSALHNELEKVLFTYNRKDIRHNWIINLVNDSEFYKRITDAINFDIQIITKFMRECDFIDERFSHDHLIKLNQFKIKLLSYRQTLENIHINNCLTKRKRKKKNETK